MNTLLAHGGFRAQGDRVPIPGTWVMGNGRPRHRDGIHVVRCIDIRQPRVVGKGLKVEILFEILGGPYPSADAALADVARLADSGLPGNRRDAATVPLFCNVSRVGKVLHIGSRSKLYEVLSRVLGDREAPRDADPTMLLAGRAFIVEIATVERDWRKQPLRPEHRYSKIAHVIGHVPELDECPDEDPPPF